MSRFSPFLRRSTALVTLCVAHGACHTYRPATIASLTSLKGGDYARFESASDIRFGAIATDGIDDHCRATRIEGKVGGNHGQVIALRFSKFQGAASADTSCTYLRGESVSVFVPDEASIVTTRRYFSWYRTIGLSVTALVAYFAIASAYFFSTVPL